MHLMFYFQRIVNKAVQINALLYRNLRHCPMNIKCTCYNTMIHPIVEYAVIVWDPYNIVNINKLEAIQRDAAKSVQKTSRDDLALLLC